MIVGLLAVGVVIVVVVAIVYLISFSVTCCLVFNWRKDALGNGSAFNATKKERRQQRRREVTAALLAILVTGVGLLAVVLVFGGAIASM